MIDGKSATKEIRLLLAPNVGAIPGRVSEKERVIKQKQHARNTNNNKARDIVYRGSFGSPSCFLA
jgi:hypothetical protein